MGRHNNKGKYKKKREQRGLRVDVRHNNIEGALKIFKRMTKDSGILLELKKRSYYKKPSEEKREKSLRNCLAISTEHDEAKKLLAETQNATVPDARVI